MRRSACRQISVWVSFFLGHVVTWLLVSICISQPRSISSRGVSEAPVEHLIGTITSLEQVNVARQFRVFT